MSDGNRKEEQEVFDVEEFISRVMSELWQIKASLLGDGSKLSAAYHLGVLIQFVNTVEQNLVPEEIEEEGDWNVNKPGVSE